MEIKNSPSITFLIPAHNSEERIRKSIDVLLEQDYPNFEILIVDDGSTDNTREILRGYEEKYKNFRVLAYKKQKGFSAANNTGLKSIKTDFVAFFGDDCIVPKDWIKRVIPIFTSEKIAVVCKTKYYYNGSCVRKKVLDEVGYFDEEFNKCIREDAELHFRIEEAGYKIRATPKAGFVHDHPIPKNKLKYAWNRVLKHEWDVLLLKKHPEKTKKYLDVKFGFICNPMIEFRIATGLWARNPKNFSLSSPQGIRLIENKTIFHEILIISFGLLYVFLLKLVRLYGSLVHKKLLI